MGMTKLVEASKKDYCSPLEINLFKVIKIETRTRSINTTLALLLL